MVYQTLASVNLSEGFEVLPLFINNTTDGLLGNLLLASIWLLTLLVAYYSERRTTGRADLFSCAAYAGLITMISGTVLKMITGLIGSLAYSVVVIVGIASILMLMIQKETD